MNFPVNYSLKPVPLNPSLLKQKEAWLIQDLNNNKASSSLLVMCVCVCVCVCVCKKKNFNFYKDLCLFSKKIRGLFFLLMKRVTFFKQVYAFFHKLQSDYPEVKNGKISSGLSNSPFSYLCIHEVLGLKISINCSEYQ